MEATWLENASKLGRLYPLTLDLNNYLVGKGLSAIPVITGRSVTDIIEYAYSQGMEGKLMNKALKILHYSRMGEEISKGGKTALSKFVIDWLVFKFDTEGPLAISEIYESMGEPIEAKELFTRLGMLSVIAYIDFNPKFIDIEASMAAYDPERFGWLIGKSSRRGVEYLEGKDMATRTEFVCLTLVKCFENASSEVEFRRSFKELFEVYARGSPEGHASNIAVASAPNSDLCMLLSDIRQSYGLIEDYDYPDASYFEDYRRAMLLACEVYGVSLVDLFATCPDVYERYATPSVVDFSIEFFNN